MKKVKQITSFALALLVAGAISISSTNVQAKEINSVAKSVEFAAEENKLTPTGTNIVDYAKQLIGTPYKSNGTTKSGFDCSGFTMYVYNHFNIKLPHSAKDQTAKGTVVSKDGLQIGDLVFFGKSISHVGIYVGNGKFIHSPKPGAKVKIEELKYMPNYNTARRIVSKE
jgi:cell wall-associated NlpC family hydrolase